MNEAIKANKGVTQNLFIWFWNTGSQFCRFFNDLVKMNYLCNHYTFFKSLNAGIFGKEEEGLQHASVDISQADCPLVVAGGYDGQIRLFIYPCTHSEVSFRDGCSMSFTSLETSPDALKKCMKIFLK